MNFTDLGIKEEFVNALKKVDITTPTAIQKEAVPNLVDGKDAYISSQTGTGKTLAFLLPIVNKIDSSAKNLQSIILAPTHELALQIHEQALMLGKDAGIRSQVIIGSASTKRQLEALKKKPHIVIGSSGRIVELIKMKKLKPHTVKTIVVDEVDRLLHGDSLDYIKMIIKSTLRDRQLVFVSATEQRESLQEAERLTDNMVKIHTGCNEVINTIDHLSFMCEERKKPELLRKLIHAVKPEKAIVFVHRNEDAEIIAEKLQFHKMKVVDIHGKLSKDNRRKALQDFKSGKAQVMISSDVAARGLDIKGVTHIFNFALPAQSSAYLHRVGRTGRAGATGQAIILMTKQESRLVNRYKKELNIDIKPCDIAKGKVFEIEV